MPECKNIRPRNSDGQRHGYWEVYHNDGTLYYKGNYRNGENDGYWEVYNFDGTLDDKLFYARM